MGSEPVTVEALYLGGSAVALENCRSVGNVMAKIAIMNGRLAADVVVLTRDTAKELLYNQDSPTKVSVVLKPTAPLEPDELNLSFVLYAAECNIPVSGETFSLPPGADIEDATFDGHSKDPWGCGCSYQRWTALTRACYHGLNDFVRKLLERGADANICATGAYHVSSPLMLASGGGTTFCSNADLVEILLEYGANVNFLGSDSCGDTTALSRACCCGYKDIVLILLKNKCAKLKPKK
eukprot:GEMP01024527.1.p1 GENE.GEMP01024527.1~~GEMP01024527.1.p1  ORF type:complete len:245 (+),score=31.90 GEMP01024527.1:23-736(+)